MNFVKDNNIPYIYSGIENIDNFSVDTYVKISSLANSFNEEEYNKIYDVLTGNNGEFHYSNQEFNSNNYNMNLTKPNYITLLNIRIIKKLIMSNFTNKEDIASYINDDVCTLVDNLNINLGYKNPNNLFKKIYKKK